MRSFPRAATAVLRGLVFVAATVIVCPASAQNAQEIEARFGIAMDLRGGRCEIVPDDLPVYARAFTATRTLHGYEQSCGFEYANGLRARGLTALEPFHDNDLRNAHTRARSVLWSCAKDPALLRSRLRPDAFVAPDVAQCRADRHVQALDEAVEAVRALQALDLRAVPEATRAERAGPPQADCVGAVPDVPYKQLSPLLKGGPACSFDRDGFGLVNTVGKHMYAVAELRGACGRELGYEAPKARAEARDALQRRARRLEWLIEECMTADQRTAYQRALEAYVESRLKR